MFYFTTRLWRKTTFRSTQAATEDLQKWNIEFNFVCVCILMWIGKTENYSKLIYRSFSWGRWRLASPKVWTVSCQTWQYWPSISEEWLIFWISFLLISNVKSSWNCLNQPRCSKWLLIYRWCHRNAAWTAYCSISCFIAARRIQWNFIAYSMSIGENFCHIVSIGESLVVWVIWWILDYSWGEGSEK